MLLPEKKERESRFRLALRMGLPIFALVLALVSSSLITNHEPLPSTFYFISILLLVFSIYFIFFLIYKGFDERITERVSKTFTREYLYTLLRKRIKKEYTLLLLSINNLHNINTEYGIKNGDKVLYEFVRYLGEYLKDKNITNFPIGHIKGGDFIIGLEGKKEEYTTMLELLYLKSSELKINEIEVNISGAITDTSFSNNLEYLIENLFEIQEESKNKKVLKTEITIDPNELELQVINAIKKELLVITTQNVYENNKLVMKECFTKLIDPNGKVLHPKSYIKLVNKLGLITQYDSLVLRKSIEQYKNTQEELFCITVHPTSLRNRYFLEKIKNSLEDNPELKGKIVLMMSETQYYSHIDRYNYTLGSLRKQGVKIALDKLGVLHTSYQYLRDLDIDIVRFDTLFTKSVNKKSYRSALEGFNTMAQKMGVKTWIKMLENEDTKAFAQEIGINYIQGNILSEVDKNGENK